MSAQQLAETSALPCHADPRQNPGQTDPLTLSIFDPRIFRMYPPADHIKDYISEEDMTDIIKCYSGQPLIEEQLSKAELQAQGVQTWQEFVVQRAYASYFEI